MQSSQEIENVLLCAHWLVRQFEEIRCQELAALFSRAVEDAEAWVHSMVITGRLADDAEAPIEEREAKSIHRILVKYASISDEGARENILQEMIRLTYADQIKLTN